MSGARTRSAPTRPGAASDPDPASKSGTPTETVVFDGLGLANTIRAELSEEISKLTAAGHRAPCLAVVLVGDMPCGGPIGGSESIAMDAAQLRSEEHVRSAATLSRHRRTIASS